MRMTTVSGLVMLKMRLMEPVGVILTYQTRNIRDISDSTIRVAHS